MDEKDFKFLIESAVEKVNKKYNLKLSTIEYRRDVYPSGLVVIVRANCGLDILDFTMAFNFEDINNLRATPEEKYNMIVDRLTDLVIKTFKESSMRYGINESYIVTGKVADDMYLRNNDELYKQLSWSESIDYRAKRFMKKVEDKRNTREVRDMESKIKEVIFNDPATIVLWKDGTKTVVKCGPGDTYDPEKGLALCMLKKQCGNKGNFNNLFRKYIPEENKSLYLRRTT